MKVVNLPNRAARRRVQRNAEISADTNAQQITAVIMTVRDAIKRDGTVGSIKQAAFVMDMTEENQQEAVRLLLEWAYNYSTSKESRETGIARILSPEATVLYRQIKESETPELGLWSKLFWTLERDHVKFHTETRGFGPAEAR